MAIPAPKNCRSWWSTLCEKGSVLPTLALTIALLAASATSLDISKTWLRSEAASNASTKNDEPLYLPQAEYVQLVSLGFNNFMADILWFNTINYFGKQFQDGKRDYRWLAQMCDLVTALDPKRRIEYEFCSNMIAWEAKEFEKSQRLLERAIRNHPKSWRFRYLHGFNAWYFLEDKETAAKDLELAAKLPGAPSYIASLASRLIADTDDVQTAIAFLRELYHNAKDENEKAAILKNIRRAEMSQHVKVMRSAVAKFKAQYPGEFKELNQLVEKGLLKEIPKDPFGGTYFYAAEWNDVASSSGEKPLEFHGKTKDTGIFSVEHAGR